MILSKQKPLAEILQYLEGENRVFIIGCNGCAQSSGSGGPEQVREMAERLKAGGKDIAGTLVVDFLCQKALVKSKLRGRIEQVQSADSLLVMTCGIGIQAVAASVQKVCHPGCDTLSLGGMRGEWQGNERCIECGQCILEYTGGICPRTACTKGLMNGQCGGASHGKCELNPEVDCGWELIYKRMKALGQLEKLKLYLSLTDYNKARPEVSVMSSALWALEK